MPESWSSSVPLLAGEGALHRRLEAGLRDAIRSGRLRAGHALPSTRGLAADLGVSRGVVVEAYAQLRAEGWLEVRPGAPHRVAAVAPDLPADAGVRAPARPRHDLRPGGPDPLLFPRAAWAAALRAVVRAADPAALDYPDVLGVPALRQVLAEYLARVRGVRAGAGDVVVCAGVGHALALAGRALRAAGVDHVAVEDPSHAGTRAVLHDAGLAPLPVPVDERGLVVDALPDAAGAVLVTPAHQFPTGAVLHPDRRAALVAWARRRDAVILEDDYDAEYRYDRHPIGALQGLAPDRVVYCGSVSKTLSPALRLGWAVVPAPLRPAVAVTRERSDLGSPGLEQLALAGFVARGEYDRHLRRSRIEYRRRRDALVAALHTLLPGARIGGAAAGLHLVLGLDGDEEAALAAARDAGVGLAGMGEHAIARELPPALILGYARIGPPALRDAARALAAATSG